jgi:hypothetical protein
MTKEKYLDKLARELYEQEFRLYNHEGQYQLTFNIFGRPIFGFYLPQLENHAFLRFTSRNALTGQRSNLKWSVATFAVFPNRPNGRDGLFWEETVKPVDLPYIVDVDEIIKTLKARLRRLRNMYKKSCKKIDKALVR